MARYIRSLEQLEILCLLAENPARNWSEPEVYDHIQSSHPSVAGNLKYFVNQRILVFDFAKGYRFGPASKELNRFALELVKTYKQRRVAVIEALYRNRLDPIREFAAAFRVRKDPS